MSNRVILMFGMEQPFIGVPTHYFWLYLVDQKKIIDQAFSNQPAAADWARQHGATVVEDWVSDELVELEEVVAENTESGASVVCITLYRNGRPVPNDSQPAHRYWIFRADGTRIATRATLREALGWIGPLPSVDPSQGQETPRPKSPWESERHT